MSKTRPKADNNRELSDAELLGVSGGRDLLQALATGADALVKQRPRQPSEIWTSGSSSPPALILLRGPAQGRRITRPVGTSDLEKMTRY